MSQHVGGTTRRGSLASVVVAATLVLLPTVAGGMSLTRVADPKEIPACTSALVGGHVFGKRATQSCLMMMGGSKVVERCKTGPRGYMIDLSGWRGIPLDAFGDWTFRLGHIPSRLTKPSYSPRQLYEAICG